MAFGPPDPVAFGFVRSLASPGGNITGVSYWAQPGYEAKRMELLKEALPRAARIAYLVMPGQFAQTFVDEAQQAASSLSIELVVVEVRGGDYDGAFARIRNGRASAMLVAGTPNSTGIGSVSSRFPPSIGSLRFTSGAIMPRKAD
jgi:putative ABC transport system substrate-binding protein